MLDKVEQLAPQWFLAVVAIVITVAVLLYNNPPHQLCDTQKNAYISKQKKFLASSSYDKFFDRCLETNNSGGCEPYFSGFKKVLDDFRVLDGECHQALADMSRVRTAFTSFLVQVTRLAWGSDGPSSIHVSKSWLGPRHLRVFCRIKGQYRHFYGEKSYQAIVNKVVQILPNEKQRLTKEQKLGRSLFSTPCSQYF